MKAYKPEIPYNDLPELPPACDIESRAVLKRCIKAYHALADLKATVKINIPQSALINLLMLLEAKFSSEIENTVATCDELFNGLIQDRNATEHSKEILRYKDALWKGFDELKPHHFSINQMICLCQIIKNERNILRDQEIVTLANSNNGNINYSPPRGRTVIYTKMRNLIHFLNDKNSVLDTLVKMIIAHYQFEAIHPFLDGNGRTGRILNVLSLISDAVLELPVLCLSKFIIDNKAEYYHRLKMVTQQQDWKGWLIYMLDGLQEAAIWTVKQVHKLYDLFTTTCVKCRAELPAYIYSDELMRLIFMQPYCRISRLVEHGIAKRQTASVYLHELERIGILEGHRYGKNTIYKHKRLMDFLF